MADIVGPLRPSDSWSTTEVRSLQHSHVWTIRGFSQCECRYLETSVKVKETPIPTGNVDGSHLTFRIRLHPQGNKESNKDFSFFQVFCNTNTAKYRAKFSVFNAKNEEAPTTVYTGTQQLHGYFEYIRRDLLVNHIQPQDELQLVLALTITFDTVTKSSQSMRQNGLPEPRPAEIARDLEVIYKEGRLTDFTVIAGGREMPAHQVVLSARSPVFAAMLEPHTEEFKNKRVNFPDIDYEVMQELLLYMYSGRSPNLSNMALDLLAAADRFQLPGLKDMADQVLRSGLAVESACRYLVFADMHNARELKADAIKFIAQNSASVITTDGWAEMVKQQPSLVTEVVSAIAAIEPRVSSLNSSSASAASMEPSSKRSRMSAL
uniref:BTB domain-containing protein n=1 Tax=Parascaris univalens TaxID=6257 RepID=A0A914ZMV5_PARUN